MEGYHQKNQHHLCNLVPLNAHHSIKTYKNLADQKENGKKQTDQKDMKEVKQDLASRKPEQRSKREKGMGNEREEDDSSRGGKGMVEDEI